jgi:hypothetical protein
MVTSRLAFKRGLQKESLSFTCVKATGLMGYCATAGAERQRTRAAMLHLIILNGLEIMWYIVDYIV